jgi:hypothetical protein
MHARTVLIELQLNERALGKLKFIFGEIKAKYIFENSPTTYEVGAGWTDSTTLNDFNVGIYCDAIIQKVQGFNRCKVNQISTKTRKRNSRKGN